MERRAYLGLAAAASVAGCLDDIRNSVDSATQTHGPTKEFGVGSPGFESAGWTEQGQFEVVFEDDHGMDGWGIRYHAHTDFNDDITLREAPDFGGTESLDLLEQFDQYDGRPPAGEYEIIAYEGRFSQFANIIDNELGSVSFYIEPDLSAEPIEITDEYEFRGQVTNDGNSPCLIDTIGIEGKETEVGTIVHPDESTEITSAPDIFPPDEDDPSCMALPESFTISFQTTPKQDLAISTQSDFESERVCTLQF